MNQPNSSSSERELIEQRIVDLEKQGRFDIDANDDPPTIPLKRGQVDFSYKKLGTKIQTYFANKAAHNYFEKEIKKGNLVIKDVIGLENYRKVNGGAVITCNHFNPYDNYAVYKAIEKDLGKHHQLYKVIREGNFTSFPGIYGYFFRHCNTLPIPSDLHVMGDFLKGVNVLLKRGEKVLVYPEQALWLNYKKPRPLKSGAFNFAATSNVPVIPFFISLEDNPSKKDADGYPMQIYTIHIMEPIYPDTTLFFKERVKKMMDENYLALKNKYEEIYGEPLTYTYKGKIS